MQRRELGDRNELRGKEHLAAGRVRLSLPEYLAAGVRRLHSTVLTTTLPTGIVLSASNT